VEPAAPAVDPMTPDHPDVGRAARGRETWRVQSCIPTPPGLSPMAERRAVDRAVLSQKRPATRSITVRYCGPYRVGASLGFAPVPDSQGLRKGRNHAGPERRGGVGLTHWCGLIRGAVGRVATGAVRFGGCGRPNPHDVLAGRRGSDANQPCRRKRAEAGGPYPPVCIGIEFLFCAKEATYKAWFPLTKRWLGFEDAHIIFGRPTTPGSAGSFEIDHSDRRGHAVRPAVEHTGLDGWVSGPRVGADGGSRL